MGNRHYDVDYREVLNYLIAKYGYCRIVDASLHPNQYGMTLADAMDIGTNIYMREHPLTN